MLIDIPIFSYFFIKKRKIEHLDRKAKELLESVSIYNGKILFSRPMQVEFGTFRLIYLRSGDYSRINFEFKPSGQPQFLRELEIPKKPRFFVVYEHNYASIIEFPAVRILDEEYYIDDKSYIFIGIVPPMKFKPKNGRLRVEYKQDSALCEWHLEDQFLHCSLMYLPNTASPSTRKAKVELIARHDSLKKAFKKTIKKSSSSYIKERFDKRLLPDIEEPRIIIVNRGSFGSLFWSYNDSKKIIRMMGIETKEKVGIFGANKIILRLTLDIPFRKDKYIEVELEPEITSQKTLE